MRLRGSAGPPGLFTLEKTSGIGRPGARSGPAARRATTPTPGPGAGRTSDTPPLLRPGAQEARGPGGRAAGFRSQDWGRGSLGPIRSQEASPADLDPAQTPPLLKGLWTLLKRSCCQVALATGAQETQGLAGRPQHPASVKGQCTPRLSGEGLVASHRGRGGGQKSTALEPCGAGPRPRPRLRGLPQSVPWDPRGEPASANTAVSSKGNFQEKL